MGDWEGEKVPLSSMIGDPLVEKIDFADEDRVVDVFVIVRSMTSTGQMGTCYTGSEGYASDELRLGTLDLIHGHILRRSVDGWIDDDG